LADAGRNVFHGKIDRGIGQAVAQHFKHDSQRTTDHSVAATG
jgi:hypothetical protein